MANKPVVSAIFLSAMLLLVFGGTSLMVGEVNALEFGPYEITTYASVSASPNPAIKGQQVNITMQISPPPPIGPYNATNILGNYTLEITKPDGTHQTEGGMTADANGEAFFLYTPVMTGQYTIEFKFPQQNVTVRAATVPGYDMFQRQDIMLASSNTTTLTVYDVQSTPQPSETPTQTDLPTPSPTATQNPNASPQPIIEWVPIELFYGVTAALAAAIAVLVVSVLVLLRKNQKPQSKTPSTSQNLPS